MLWRSGDEHDLIDCCHFDGHLIKIRGKLEGTGFHSMIFGIITLYRAMEFVEIVLTTSTAIIV